MDLLKNESAKSPSKLLSPTLAFFLCLILTSASAFWAYRSSVAENTGRFERAVGSFSNTLKSRMTLYTNALISTRNIFDLKPNLSREEFSRFVSGMRLRESAPGIQSVGYVERVSGQQARKIISKLKLTSGVPVINFKKSELDLVVYVERIQPTSTTVVAMDLSESPARKAAMDKARDTGLPTATDRVVPMTPDSPQNIFAFLVVVPRYRSGLPLETVQQRRNALIGFIFGGFRAHSLFGQMSDDLRFRNSNFSMEIYDGPDFEAQRMLYSEGRPLSGDLTWLRSFEFAFANHIWSVRISAPENFALAYLRWSPYFVFALGTLLSALVGLALRRSQKLSERLRVDLLARQETERQLSQARQDAEAANQAKSMFLANISHEIRTPLGVMVGFAEMALTQPGQTDIKKSLTTIIRNGKELNRIIGDVLDVAKIEAKTLSLEMAPLSLQQMLQDIVDTWRPAISAKGLHLQTDFSDGLPKFIQSDETRVKQVLTNLLSNAVKFTQTGFINISVGTDLPEGVSLTQILFTIEDSGLGINDDNKSKLFIPFSQADMSITRKFGGSGLGLALSREIATALGGDLKLDMSVEGRGSRFTFVLPATPVPSTTMVDRKSFSFDFSFLKGKRILLVEDSVDNQVLITLILQRSGMVVEVASNGEDGVRKALNADFDLILMDIQMPVMDGNMAFRRLREATLRKPVIALTAHALKEERDKAMALGFAAYLTKPIDREILLTTISKIIRSSGKEFNHQELWSD